MPGLTVVCTLTEPLPVRPRAPELNGQLRFDGRYQTRTLFSNPHLRVLCVDYPAYPIACFDTPDYWIGFEGRAYSIPPAQLETELVAAAQHVFSKTAAQRSALVHWLQSTDADMVLVLVHKRSGEFAVLNGHFGRLHLYARQTEHSFAVSREIRFFAEQDPPVAFDRLGIAQLLLFGFPLGRRTLFDGVARLLPATLVHGHPGAARVVVERLYLHNYEPKERRDRSVAANARDLAELFVASCRNRCGSGRPAFIALSGGLDSRGVAAGCVAAGVPARTGTFLDHHHVVAQDVVLAEQVAGVLGLPWARFDLGPPRARNALALRDAKQGLNAMRFSDMFPFFRWILQSCGPDVVYLAGDVGGYLLKDYRPIYSLRSLDDLLAYILQYHTCFDTATVSALTGLPQSDLVENLRQVLNAYPEGDWNQKFVHFVTFARNGNWLGEGEDRNRYFFWHAAPCAAPPFAVAAMQIPDEQKTDARLYHEFLRALAPQVLEPGLTTYRGARRTSAMGRAVRLKHFFNRRAHWIVQPLDWLQQRRLAAQGRPWSALYQQCFARHLRDWGPAEEYLRKAAIEMVLQNSQLYGRQVRSNLLTLVSLLEHRLCGRDTLAEMGDTELV